MSTNGNSKQPRLEPTSDKEWKSLREQGIVLQLPSEFKARVRPVRMEGLLRIGTIPDTLSGLVAEIVWNGAPRPDTVFRMGKEAIELLDIVVAASFMEPVCVIGREPEDGEISIDDVDLGDKNFIFTWVTAPTVALHRFRNEQERSLAAVQPEQDQQPAAQ